MQSELNQICQFPCSQKWDLVYRASRDGFGRQNFHSKCDGIPNSLLVVKSENGFVFGGFTEKGFTYETRVDDSGLILFSLMNPEGKPFIATCIDSGENSVCFSTGGIGFGYKKGQGKYSYDIYVCFNSDVNINSYSNLGNRFKYRDSLCGKENTHLSLTGLRKFKTFEIELFKKGN